MAAINPGFMGDAEIVRRHQVVAEAGGDVQDLLGPTVELLQHIFEAFHLRFVSPHLFGGNRQMDRRAQPRNMVRQQILH